MLYPKKEEKSLSAELFQNPTNEYRGAPFWARNPALPPEVLVKHIDYFKEMGIGGFHMHCRTGLDTPYLGDEYKACVRACVDKAKKDGMYAYLYDEDRWPSGAAGGKVTKDVEYRSRYLVFTPFSNEERKREEERFDSSSKAAVQGNGTLLARYDITLEDGCLKEYRRLQEGETGSNGWYLYEEIAGESPWYNNETLCGYAESQGDPQVCVKKRMNSIWTVWVMNSGKQCPLFLRMSLSFPIKPR